MTEMDKKNRERAESPNTDLSSESFSSVAREEAVNSKGNEILIFPWKGGHSAQTEPEALGDSGALSQETKEDSVAGALFFANGSVTFENGELAVAEGKYTDAGEAVAGSSGLHSVETEPQRVPSTVGHDDQSVPFTLPIRFKAA